MYSLLVKHFALSQMISAGVPSTEKQKPRVEITSLEAIEDLSSTYGYLLW